ncbi:hypothetical protein ACXGQW_00335 [Wenyingzhuangia sp. IMCC45533]
MRDFKKPRFEKDDKYVVQGSLHSRRNLNIEFLIKKYDYKFQHIKDRADVFPYCCEYHESLSAKEVIQRDSFKNYGTTVIKWIYYCFNDISNLYRNDKNNFKKQIKVAISSYIEKFGFFPNSSPFLLNEFITSLNVIIQDSNMMDFTSKRDIEYYLEELILKVNHNSSIQKKYLYSNFSYEKFISKDCTTIEKQFKLGNKEINSNQSLFSCSSEISNSFLIIFQDYFDTEDQIELKELINGKKINKKLRFKNNGNKLLDSFKKLYINNLLCFSTKKDLITWVIDNFMFLKNGKTSTEFTYKNAEDQISSKINFRKNPIIDIIKENNTILITKYTG